MEPEEQVPATEQQPEDTRFLDQQKRAEKAEAEAKEYKDQLESIAQQMQEEPKLEEKQEEPNQFDTLADNLSVLKPLETDEVEELRTQSKNLGVDPIKFAQSPAWKTQLESLRANKQAEDKTLAPSNRVAVFEGKTFADVVNDGGSTPDTKQAAFESQRDALLNRGRNQIM